MLPLVYKKNYKKNYYAGQVACLFLYLPRCTHARAPLLLAFAHARAHTRARAHAHAHKHTHTHTHTHARTHAYTHTHARTHTHTHTHTHVRSNTNARTRTHTRTHEQTNTCNLYFNLICSLHISALQHSKMSVGVACMCSRFHYTHTYVV